MTGTNNGKGKHQAIDEQVLLSAAKATLDSMVDELDVDTVERLAAIRRQAVATLSDGRQYGFNKPAWLFPVAGLATAAAALLVMLTLWMIQPADHAEPVAVLEDINLLTGSEEIEFYQDLEFYEWLAANEQNVS